MKKYLMTGIAAVAMCAAFTSCSKDTTFEQITPEQTIQADYDAAFIKAFGQPASNQTWGFGTTVTRYAFTNSNQWDDLGYKTPAAITEGERDTVMTYFRTTKNPLSETINITDYFVQHVDYTDTTYTTSYQNGGTTVNVAIVNPGRSHMDYIFAGPGTDWQGQPINYNDGDDHINNLNANSGLIQFMRYTGSEYFGFHDSQGTGYSSPGKSTGKYCTVNRNYVIRFIEHGGQIDCYVGLNYETGKTSEGWHIDPDEYFSDRVIKLIPGNGSWFDGRIMAEDLSAKESGDFDFNDVVFDYKLNGNQTANIKLRAAGGTLELYVGGEANADKTAIIGGHEVHGEFGVGINTMVNTGVTTAPKDPEIFSVTCKDDDPINIKIWVKKGDKFMELTAHTGQPASKFKTKITTKWCDEYISIINPYPNFATWVGDPNVDWTTPFYERFADQNLNNNEGAIKGHM